MADPSAEAERRREEQLAAAERERLRLIAARPDALRERYRQVMSDPELFYQLRPGEEGYRRQYGIRTPLRQGEFSTSPVDDYELRFLYGEAGFEEEQSRLRERAIEEERGARRFGIQKRVESLGGLSDELGGALGGQYKSYESASDRELQRLLEEAKLQGSEAQRKFGADISARGLGRSSFAQRGFEDIASQRLEAEGQARLEKTQKLRGAKLAQYKAVTDVQREMEKTAAGLSKEKLESLDAQVFLKKKAEIEEWLKNTRLSNAIDAADEASMMGLWGEIGGAAATIISTIGMAALL